MKIWNHDMSNVSLIGQMVKIRQLKVWELKNSSRIKNWSKTIAFIIYTKGTYSVVLNKSQAVSGPLVVYLKKSSSYTLYPTHESQFKESSFNLHVVHSTICHHILISDSVPESIFMVLLFYYCTLTFNRGEFESWSVERLNSLRLYGDVCLL